MTRETRPTTNETGAPVSDPLSGEFDPAEFVHFLEETDWSDDEKAEYVRLVWNVMCQFVALGFDVHPIQQARDNCGKLTDERMVSPLLDNGVVNSSYGNLVEKFMRLNGVESDAGEEGVVNE